MDCAECCNDADGNADEDAAALGVAAEPKTRGGVMSRRPWIPRICCLAFGSWSGRWVETMDDPGTEGCADVASSTGKTADLKAEA